nr:MAG TPA: hypothetical protein [Bacteriophage sp.]
MSFPSYRTPPIYILPLFCSQEHKSMNFYLYKFLFRFIIQMYTKLCTKLRR